MSDNLQERVSAWLAKEGYPLEMAVAAEFRRAGFWVVQSDYFEDPKEKVQREIDVVARVQSETEAGLIRISFVIECKASRDKPWVLFTADSVRLAEPARVIQRTASTTGKRFLHRLAERAEIRGLPFFTLPERPAYGLTQSLGQSERDLSYQAISGVSAAAVAQALAADEAMTRTKTNIIEVVFPVVLLDGRLFEAYLNGAGELNVAEVESGVLVWRKSAGSAGNTIIRIVTRKALEALVQEAMTTASALLAEKDLLLIYALVSPKT